MENGHQIRYISLDAEYGGFGLESSLLTACFIVANDKFEPIDILDLSLIPNDHIYHVNPEALLVNKIDIVTLYNHDAIRTYKEAAGLLYNFLNTHSNQGADKLILIGKNVWGDCLQIWDKLLKRATFEVFVSYRWLDITSVVQWLKLMGKIPEDISGSLESVANFLNIETKPSDLHTAIGDATLNLKIMKRLRNL